MAKLTLQADPTFTVGVPFPVAGGPSVEVRLTFRHRTKRQLEAFIAERAERSDVDTFLDMVTAWDLADEMNRANVEELLDNRIGVALAVFQAYIDELTKARTKN